VSTDRIKTAIEFLKDGQSFKVGDLRLGIERGILVVSGWSQYAEIENVNKQIALRELDEIKTIFQVMKDESEELRSFVANKKIEYHLYYNYGMGSIEMCYEAKGTVKWKWKFD